MTEAQAPSYWQASAPDFSGGRLDAVEGAYDVAVIGGGFTGLSAARALARSGAQVALFESGRVCSGASGRNGGQCNAGTAHNFGELAAAHGVDQARAWYQSFCDAVDTVERVAAEEQIQCNFVRCGRAKLAAKPKHFAKLEKSYELLKREVDQNVSLVAPEKIGEEIGSAAFHGALIQHTSARFDIGVFGAGLADAATRAGAQLWENTPVTEIGRVRAGWHVETPRGAIAAKRVLVATGGASPQAPFGWFRRRIVSVGSFAIATEPLSDALVDSLFPTRRNYVTSRIVGNYFRLTSDNRVIFGGRARFAPSNPASDAKSGRVLERTMRQFFPELAGTRIEHVWGGMIDLTMDRLPRAGEHDGLHYALGFSGHGVQMSVHLGEKMAQVMGGDTSANPFASLDWPAIPGNAGKEWMLPLVGAYYRLKDAVH